MKKAIGTIGLLVAGYWLLSLSSQPESQDAMVFMPREASIAGQMPTRRQNAISVQESVVEPSPVLGDPSDARALADRFVESKREEWNIQPWHDLKWEASYPSPLGTVVKYKVYQGDLLLTGMDVEVRVSTDNQVLDSTVHYRPVTEVDGGGAVSQEDVADLISNRFETVGQAGTPMIFVPGNENGTPEQAIAMTVRRKGDETGGTMQAIFRARDGQVLEVMEARAEFQVTATPAQ